VARRQGRRLQIFFLTYLHVCMNHQTYMEPATDTKAVNMVGWLDDWSLTALSTQFRSYRTLKVKLYYKY